MKKAIKKFDFFKTKYGDELLVDLIRLESLEKYIIDDRPHYLTYYDITLVTGGKGSFQIDQYTYPIRYGSVLLTSPRQIRYWDIEILPTGYVLIFEEAFLSCFLKDIQFINDLKYFNNWSSPPELSLSESDTSYLIQQMLYIEQEIKSFRYNDQHILKALLYQILVWLNRKYSATYPSAHMEDFNRYIRKYIKLVNQDFYQHRLVSYYSDSLNITTGHLNDLCKTHLGISAKRYIQKRVILEAKRLLIYSDLQVSEIASCLNFEDPPYFIREFKKFTGVTPVKFRKNKNP